jgi:Zn-dependent peptidase ImmA (M78 family)
VLSEIAAAVVAARERLRLTRVEVADAAGLEEDALSTLERGERGVSTADVVRLARALRLEPVALLRGRAVEVLPSSVFLRRSATPDFDERDAAVLEAALRQGRALRELLRTFHAPILAFGTEPIAGPEPEQAAKQGYALARRVRNALDAPIEPLGDLREMLERRFGIAVLVRALHTRDVAAASVRSDAGATAILNADDKFRAKNPIVDRVHLAHELGHVLFDPSEGGVHVVLDREKDRPNQLAEARARGFAAELLLPSEGLKKLLGPPGKAKRTAADVVQLARRRFATPFEIAVNHLQNHGHISREAASSLKETAFRPRIPGDSTLPLAGAPSLELVAATRSAYDKGVLTDRDSREILGLTDDEHLPW